MKRKSIFYLVSVLSFSLLFYERFVGINLSILAIMLCVMSYYSKERILSSKSYQLALVSCIISSFAFAFYGDFTSFFVLFIALNWIAMLLFDPKQKLIKLVILAPFNYVMLLPNALSVKIGFSQNNSQDFIRKALAYGFIPLIITGVFAASYIASSDMILNF